MPKIIIFGSYPRQKGLFLLHHIVSADMQINPNEIFSAPTRLSPWGNI
jgi:hypothetical protein